MKRICSLAFGVFTAVCVASLASAEPQPREADAPLRLVLVGDSTVSNYSERDANRGWGQYIQEQFEDGTVEVTNLAIPGRSTKTFIKKGDWRKALDARPDYVFIQFGHNDSHAPDLPESTDPEGDYRDYLHRYIEESREIGAVPVLITPVVRRSFDGQGKIVESLTPPNNELRAYAQAMREVAEEMGVALIDLYASSRALAEEIGPEESVAMASRKGDITHFNEKGARIIAGLVIEDLPAAAPTLGEHLEER